jgi:hypothetical protein
MIYADYSPDPAQGAAFAQAAFGTSINSGINLRPTQANSGQLDPVKRRESAPGRPDLPGS